MDEVLAFEDFFLNLISKPKQYRFFPNILDDIKTLTFGGNGIKAYAYCVAMKLICKYWWLLKYGHHLDKKKASLEKTSEYLKSGYCIIPVKKELVVPSFIKVNYVRFSNQLVDEFCQKRIDTFAGTSSGSFFSFLLSCSVPFKFILKIMRNGKKLLQDTIDAVELDNVINNSCISNINILKMHMEECMKKNNIPLDITFEQHFKKYKKVFMCNAVCLDNEEQIIMNYKLTPDLPIVYALLASSALPGIFPPIIINSKKYVDGGIALNNLLPLFDSKTSFGFMMGNPKDLEIMDYHNRITGLKKVKDKNILFGLNPLKNLRYNVSIDQKEPGNDFTSNGLKELGSRTGTFVNFLLNHVTKCTWEMFQLGHLERVIFIKTVYNPMRYSLMDDLDRDVPIAFEKWQHLHHKKYIVLIASFLLGNISLCQMRKKEAK